MAKRTQGKGKMTNTVVGTCQCGGDLIWAKVSPQRGSANMRKVCTSCGAGV